MKLLVIGCGSAGRRHAANAKRLAEVAVLDADAGRAEACARSTGAQAFADLERALAWKPDGVVVATPPSSHLPVAALGLEAGAHLLIEKPMSHGSAGVESLLQRAESLGRKVFVVCNMRFHPGVAAVRRHLPEIGRPLYARAAFGSYLPDMRPGTDWRAQEWTRPEYGGIVLDCIHEFDYLIWLFGDVVGVAAVTDRVGDLGIAGADYAAITMRHASGVRSEIHLDYLRRPKRREIEVAGTEGALLWAGDGKNPERGEAVLHEAKGESARSLWRSAAVDANRPYEDVMRHFADALAGREAPLATGRDGARALAAALAAVESATHGSAVRPGRAG